jgi:hypothetical protein
LVSKGLLAGESESSFLLLNQLVISLLELVEDSVYSGILYQSFESGDQALVGMLKVIDRAVTQVDGGDLITYHTLRPSESRPAFYQPILNVTEQFDFFECTFHLFPLCSLASR